MEALAPNRRLAGRYVLLEPIATGGMASVWQARDEVLARAVAVKLLREDLSEDITLAERFRREAVAAARLTHPNIVSVFDAGEDEGRSYIVMEHFEGSTLHDLLAARGPLEPAAAVSMAVPVLSALGFAHEHGVIHRDVKPANILVGSDGRVKVTDFGIARAAFREGRDLTTTGAVLGTIRYLSPEQVQGSEIDARSDLYSLGVVLYEALTGRPPFLAETDVATAMMRLTNDPLPLRAIRPGISRPLEAIVLRAMARRPDDRYPTAEALRTALEQHGGPRSRVPVGRSRRLGLGPSRRPTVPARVSSRPAVHAGSRSPSLFRSWMLVPLVVALLAAAAIAVGLALGRLEVGGPLGIRAAPATPAPGTTVGPIKILAAQDVDPEGDGGEHPEEVGLAFDGNAQTSWGTDHYDSVAFGNLKDGLGLWLEFGAEVRVSRVIIVSPLPRWRFQLRAGTDPASATQVLSAQDGRERFEVGASGRITIDLVPVRTDGLMVWLTRLAPDDGRFAAAIAEVKVRGEPA